MANALPFLQGLTKGDKISIVLAGIIVDGTFEELADDCVVLSEATSPSSRKKHYSLRIQTESIYAWGNKEKKRKRRRLTGRSNGVCFRFEGKLD